MLDHLGPDVHGLVVGVADAGADVLEVQALLPFLEPFVFGVPGVDLLRGLGLLAGYLGNLAAILCFRRLLGLGSCGLVLELLLAVGG